MSNSNIMATPLGVKGPIEKIKPLLLYAEMQGWKVDNESMKGWCERNQGKIPSRKVVFYFDHGENMDILGEPLRLYDYVAEWSYRAIVCNLEIEDEKNLAYSLIKLN